MLEHRPGREARAATPEQEGLVLALVFLVLFLLTRTRDLGGDGTVFALAVESWLRGRGTWWTFFHPHHLAYNPAVAALVTVLRELGWHGLVVDAGAWLNGAVGAATVGGLTVLLRRRGVSESTALLSAVVLGCSGGFWQYSTRLEVYVAGALAALVWAAVMLKEPPRRLAAGLSLAAVQLTHIVGCVLVLPTALLLRRRPADLARVLAIGLGPPAIALGTVLVVNAGWRPTGWLSWVLPPTYGTYFGISTPAEVLRALHALLWWRWYGSVPVFGPAAVRWLDGMGLLAAGIAVVLLAGGLRKAFKKDRLAAVASLGVAAFLPLWLLWDAGNVEHTVMAAPLFAMLLAAGAESAPRRLGNWLLGGLALMLLVGNGLASALPQSRPENGRVWAVADFVRRTVPEDGVVLSLGRDPRLRLGLQYLSGRRVVDLTLLTASARRAGVSPDRAVTYWRARAEDARTVWVLPDVFDAEAGEWVRSLGGEPQELAALVARMAPLRTAVMEADGVLLDKPFRLALVVVTTPGATASRGPAGDSGQP